MNASDLFLFKKCGKSAGNNGIYMKEKRNIIYYAVTILLFAVIAFSLFKIYQIAEDYLQGRRTYKSLNEAVLTQEQEETETSEDISDTEESEKTTDDTVFDWYLVNWEALDAVSSDTAGWIVFENEAISYPVMYSGDDETYLHAAPDGSYLYAGSIFMEGENAPDFSDGHTILYGHNMKDGSMFAKLKNYQTEGYYQEHKYLQILTPQSSCRYKVFAYEDVSDDSFIYSVPYNNTEELKSFCEKLLSISWLTCDDTTRALLDGTRPVITLSTCSTEGRRFVVHAVLVSVQ